MSRNYSKNYYSKSPKKSFWPQINWRLLAKIAAFLFFLSFILGAAYFFLFSNLFKISEIIVKGNNRITNAALIGEAGKLLSEKKILFLKNDNINLLNEGNIGDKIKNAFNRIDTIAVRKEYPNKIILEIKEREMAEVLCKNESVSAPEEKTEGTDYSFDCFLIDKNGIAFEKAADSRGFLILRIIDKRGTNIELNKKVLNPEFMEFTKNLKQNFKNITNRNLRLLELEHPAQREIIALVDGWKAVFDISGDPEKQLLVLKEVLEKDIKENISKLDYIDLRVEGRAYYKLK